MTSYSISLEKNKSTKLTTFREKKQENEKSIHKLPKFGKEREKNYY